MRIREAALFLIIMSMALTGCWSKRELNELSIVSALGVDKDKGGYTVTAQVINPRQISQQTQDIQAPVTSYSTSGRTLFEAMRHLTLESPRRIYMSHLRIVVFGEELAREGIAKAIDFLLRDHEIRADFYMLVAREERAQRVLSILTPVEQIPGNKVYHALETSQRVWGPTHAVDLKELAMDLMAEGKNPVLTGIIVEGNPRTGSGIENIERVEAPAKLRIGHLAAFKGDRLVGWLDETESRGYNLIKENITNSVVTIPCEGEGNITMEITRLKTRVKGVLVNGRPEIQIESMVEANMVDAECLTVLSGEGTRQKLKERLEEEIKGFMEAAVQRARQDLKTDIFGFGRTIYRAYPKVWEELGSSWEQEYIKLPVSIRVSAKIIGLGTIGEAFESKVGE
jgi:spore germination protein KC